MLSLADYLPLASDMLFNILVRMPLNISFGIEL